MNRKEHKGYRKGTQSENFAAFVLYFAILGGKKLITAMGTKDIAKGHKELL